MFAKHLFIQVTFLFLALFNVDTDAYSTNTSAFPSTDAMGTHALEHKSLVAHVLRALQLDEGARCARAQLYYYHPCALVRAQTQTQTRTPPRHVLYAYTNSSHAQNMRHDWHEK